MKITMADGTVLEGEPQELAAFEIFKKEMKSPVEPSGNLSRSGEGSKEMSEEVAYTALTRIQLAPKVKMVLRTLYEAGEEWVSAKELQRLIGYTPAQFAGLMGAFGRRLTNTSGFVEGSSFFRFRWDDEISCFFYRLPLASRNAVRRAGLA